MRARFAPGWIALSVVMSLVALWLIVSAWANASHTFDPDAKVIDTRADLAKFINDERGGQDDAADHRIVVPTGVFIQSVAFASSSDINFTGYIWQKYPMGFPFEKGVTFPEEVLSDDTKNEPAYTATVLHNGEPHELIGSYFDVTVRQSFDYSSYPLDFLNIWLRIWPADWRASDQIILVPDFDSYTDPRQDVFGLDGDLVHGEWDIVRSFFSYQKMPYDTNFGLSQNSPVAIKPEFFFNLATERKFINAFIINLVPLMVISLLLFSTLMTISFDRAQAERFGFNTTAVLGTCSGLFFLVLLSHIQVRSLFAGSGLVYIEYFYLVLYGMILLVALNGYLFSLQRLKHSGLLHRGDNFVAKVGFWPVLLWALAIISQYTL